MLTNIRVLHCHILLTTKTIILLSWSRFHRLMIPMLYHAAESNVQIAAILLNEYLSEKFLIDFIPYGTNFFCRISLLMLLLWQLAIVSLKSCTASNLIYISICTSRSWAKADIFP